MSSSRGSLQTLYAKVGIPQHSLSNHTTYKERKKELDRVYTLAYDTRFSKNNFEVKSTNSGGRSSRLVNYNIQMSTTTSVCRLIVCEEGRIIHTAIAAKVFRSSGTSSRIVPFLLSTPSLTLAVVVGADGDSDGGVGANGGV